MARKARSGLREHARAVGEGIPNWGSEFPQDLPQGFFEFIVDHDMLIDAKISRGKILKGLYVIVGVFIPIWGQIAWSR